MKIRCRNCKKIKFKRIIKIGSQPISSIYLKKKNFKLKNYPLDLYECQSCNLIQFKKLAPLSNMYGTNYGYRTSLSPLMINHMKKKYDHIINDPSIKKNKILDIGSNDGTFLNFFAKKSFKKELIGIDPSAEKFKKYYNSKIKVIVDYFSKKRVEKFFNFEKQKKNFDLITSYAMFYDIEDPNSFVKDINKMLNKNGIWISEFSYFPLLLKNLTYDQICHEHVTYYTLKTFKKIVEKNNFKIIDVNFNEINGGSIEVFCAKKNSNKKVNRKKIEKILLDESKIDSKAYERFNTRVNNVKKVLKNFLTNLKGKKIIGYGASTKGNIVLNHCKIDKSLLPFICDANPYKFNRYTPGTNIKIVSKRKMHSLKPKYLLVLIWSFRTEVIKQEIKFIKKGGKLIFHLPIFHIVDKSNYKSFINKDFKDFSYDY